MTNDQFRSILENRLQQIIYVLTENAKEYATDDKLHNFKCAAEMLRTTPEKALWGFLTKHLVSLMDMVQKDDESPLSQWEEKIGDAINYLILLEAVVKEDKQ